MTTPSELVTEFCNEWRTGTPESIIEYFTDDAVYHNIPMQPLAGKPSILEFLRGFVANFGNIDFDIHRQAEIGDTVMNERVDRFTINGNKIELPVMGSFEVRDGKIAAWRDYFDMAPLTALGGQ